MKYIYTYLICLFFLISNGAVGQGYFNVDRDIEEAYSLVTSLRFEEAGTKIQNIKTQDPNNLMVYYVENYIDFFKVFINEEKDEFDRLIQNKDLRLEKIDGGDKTSPYYLFVKAEITLQWATARMKFGQQLTVARELYRAYKLLEENQERFPNFIENYKSLSIMHALGESIPSWIRSIAGIEGSVKLGTKEIKTLVEYSKTHEFLFKAEAYAIYSYILFYQNNKKEEAYQLLSKSGIDHRTSPLMCFLKSNFAQKTGRNQEAMQILEERENDNRYYPFPYLDFMYGKFKLYELDSEAKAYILKFLNNFKGRHFVKEAYQKLAWFEIVVNEDVSDYKAYMQLCQEQGYDLVDEDKQALREAKSKEIPNTTLLKARLLFDGGYFEEGYNLLVRKAYLFHESDQDYLEFIYRFARIVHALKNYHDAIEYYNKAIILGAQQESYMSANAALQVGLIYEDQKMYPEAIKYFDICLDMDPERYKNSLHQKAKTGLARVKSLSK